MMETKTLRIIQKLSGAGKILSKIIAICSVVGVIGCTVGIASLLITGHVEYSVDGITLHGLIENSARTNIGTLYVVMTVGLIFCIGEAVIAKRAEKYFGNELSAGTPFTFGGAKEMMRLGICTFSVSAATSIAAPIAYAVINHYYPNAAGVDLGGAFQAGTGIVFILVSLLCRYGAEREAENEADVLYEV